MARLRLVFLALAVWGAVHPMVWYVRHLRETGDGFRGLVEAWYVNASSTGLAWDLTISAATLLVWGTTEALMRRDWMLVVPLPLIFLVGLAFALPLYLFLRLRPASGAAADPSPPEPPPSA